MDVAGSGYRRRFCKRCRNEAEFSGASPSSPPPTYRSLAAPVASHVDKFALLPAFLQVRGPVKQQIDSFNSFIAKGIENILNGNDRIVALEDSSMYLRYTGVRVGVPSIRRGCNFETLTPQVCRLTDHTYSAPVRVDFEYTVHEGGDKHALQWADDVVIGYIPIMLKSCVCVLNGKDEQELARYGECPLDPGGYFIVKGNEKVIVIQEQDLKNHITIETDNKGRVTASVVSSTHKRKSKMPIKTLIVMEKEKIYLQSNRFTKLIPIIVVMKAMGIESDQEVVQMVGRDPRYGDLLLLSIQECASEKIYTQQQALRYIDDKVKYPCSGNLEGNQSKLFLHDVFLAHVPVDNGSFRAKGIYNSVMLRRMMDAILNADAFDDKDLFKRMNSAAVRTMSALFTKKRNSESSTLQGNFKQIIEKDETITLGLELAINTGNWDLRRYGMSGKGVSQSLSRLSYMASLGFLTRISSQYGKTRKTNGPRALQPSQWGMLCPCDTPEGELCGLTKKLALLTHITTDQEDGPLMNLCYSLGVEDLSILSGEEIHAPGSFLVMFNGLILGKHRKPQIFANALRTMRRSGKIGQFVSIFVNEKQHCIHIASDGGRVCRPLLIADEGRSRVQEHHMQKLRVGFYSFDDFLHDGLIEYLDVNEENNSLIALYEHEDQAGVQRSSVTHIEIEPLTILGVVSGLIPYPHHNLSSRNTYQCAMGKQAMGNIAYNQLFRADSVLYLLVYAQRPLLTTKTIELVRYDKLGAGQNAIVAVMSYSGYDIEDAIVMNKSSLDQGFGRCIVMKKYTVTLQKNVDGISEKNVKPERDKDGALMNQNMRALDEDGYATPGQIIRNRDIYVNKQTPKFTARSPHVKLTDKDYEDSPAVYRGDDDETETTIVDRVILTSDMDDKLTIKCILRHTRSPEVGDKFSSRHGQKGVCGTILQQEDFPFSERGICPDLIMNPHAFPSRMTIGKMIELLGGKAGVSCGQFNYGSAFGEPSGNADKVEDMSYTLVKHGFNYHGKDLMYSGTLGHPLETYIFMGPIYYQKLKHMVLDKIHARASGPHVPLTRQPTEGLRVGEMERDCLVAHGASMLIFERLLLSSDPFEMQVCRKCGLLGYYNHKLKAPFCSMCKTGGDMAPLKIPYAFKLLFQVLRKV